MEDMFFNKIYEILERKKQIVLYGVPGVGKTYLAKKYVEYMARYVEKQTIKNLSKQCNNFIIQNAKYTIDEEKLKEKIKIKGVIPNYREIELPLLATIYKHGGKVKPKYIYDELAELFELTPEERAKTLDDGRNCFENRVQWVRNDLKKKGEIGGEIKGVWDITEKGIQRLINEGVLKESPKISESLNTSLNTKNIENKMENCKNNNYLKFVTFHQSYAYEEFIEGLKPKTENREVIYDVEDGIFKKMCILAIWDVLKKKFNTLIEIFKEKYPTGSMLKTISEETFEIINYDDDTISIKPLNGVGMYSLLIKKLEGFYSNPNIKRPSDIPYTNSTYYYAILKELKQIEEELKNFTYKKIKQKVIEAIKNKSLTKEDFKNAPKYYLIIDEINRGNISNIFGELITLLEKDKRLTEENEMIVELPYSKEPFAVPPNLYIIGTMNTADKSIALLDIALRRRFGFLEIEPEYNLIDKEIEEINLKELLETINDKITILKDRDHRIGHSYFLNVKNIKDLKFVWYNEIIPLLMEYFYNDWKCLKEILKDFVEEKKLDIIKNSDLIDYEEQKIYKIKEFEDNREFIKALNSIIK